MRRIKITFGAGDIIFAVLDEIEGANTASILWDSLPLESTVMQSRWSGREVNLGVSLTSTPPRENQTIYTSIGELCYWRDWRLEGEKNPKHVLAIYYGAEMARSHMGDEPVNIVGQVEYKYFDKLKEIGNRIWLEGTEKIKIERVG